MEEHLTLSLILIVIQRVIFSIVELDKPVNPTDCKVLLTPTQLELSNFAVLSVVDGFLDLLDDGLWFNLLLLLEP